jgi:hypothetical protein
LVSAVPAAASVEASESASTCDEADAEPSPTEVPATSTLAEDVAATLPSSLVAELAASAAAVPLIDPPPVVSSSMSASAAEEEVAELTSADASVAPDAKAWPEAVPSPVDVPLRLADDVTPSSVAAVAPAEPVADAPAPEVTSSTDASDSPSSVPKRALLAPSPVALSVVSPPVVASVPPVALACVDAEESAELPVSPTLCAAALLSAELVAPAPVACASECDDELAEPPPAVAWLSEDALAEAAKALIELSQLWTSGATGAAASTRAKALVEIVSFHFRGISIVVTPKNVRVMGKAWLGRAG